MRYIDVDVFADRLLNAWSTADEQKRADIVCLMANIVTPILVGTPTADVKEVVRGEWIERGSDKFINLSNANEQYKSLGYPHRKILKLQCTNCHLLTLVDASIGYDFCPHCGADMRGDKDDTRKSNSRIKDRIRVCRTARMD